MTLVDFCDLQREINKTTLVVSVFSTVAFVLMMMEIANWRRNDLKNSAVKTILEKSSETVPPSSPDLT
jgi:hypothetical protein